MTEKELTDFFDNFEYELPFVRTKKIYELTNNLDLHLLKVLREDFRRHFLKKGLQSVKNFDIEVLGEEAEEVYKYHLGMDFINVYNSRRTTKIDIKNDTLDNIIWSLSRQDYDLAEVIYEGMADFIYEVDELIRYKTNQTKSYDLAHNEKNTETEDELIDYSESNHTSKIIFLEKLGVIEYLRGKSPFNNSTNSFANALSGVTGIKPTTLQPMLNAMLSKGTSDKNNPLKSTKTVNVVNNKLANIGFNVD